jgi:hypothetical protein
MLDRSSVVTSRFFEAAYQERNTITSMLVRLGARLDIAGTLIGAPHLTVKTYLTDQSAAPGTHFSAVIDIDPEKNVHVYAPGVSGYKPIAVAIAPQPGLVVRAAQFPKSEDYFFKPLNEHVRVFQKPFRLVQDLEIDPAPQAAASLTGRSSMTITGTLQYQACDDKVCFTPQSVPLSWTISLKPLDRERATKR